VFGFSRASGAGVVGMDILVERLNGRWLKIVVCWWYIRGETRINVLIIVAGAICWGLLYNRRCVSSRNLNSWTAYRKGRWGSW
jgi:hypothetical protein